MEPQRLIRIFISRPINFSHGRVGKRSTNQKSLLISWTMWKTRSKSKEFLRKTKDFRGQWDGGPDDVAEVGLRLDLSMGCKK